MQNQMRENMEINRAPISSLSDWSKYNWNAPKYFPHAVSNFIAE